MARLPGALFPGGWAEAKTLVGQYISLGIWRLQKWPHSFEQQPEGFKWILC